MPVCVRAARSLQAFSCALHLAVIRLFVESILRYGLPPQFQAAVIKPLPKMEARLRAALATNFGTGGCVWVRGRTSRIAWDDHAVMAWVSAHWLLHTIEHACRCCTVTCEKPTQPSSETNPNTSDVNYWKEDAAVAAAAGALASEIDQYPYISITLNTGD
jgi:hypothetical protein